MQHTSDTATDLGGGGEAHEPFLHVLEVVRVLEIHAGPAFLVSACEPSQLSAVEECSRLREQQARRLRVKVGLAFPRNFHP